MLLTLRLQMRDRQCQYHLWAQPRGVELYLWFTTNRKEQEGKGIMCILHKYETSITRECLLVCRQARTSVGSAMRFITCYRMLDQNLYMKTNNANLRPCVKCPRPYCANYFGSILLCIEVGILQVYLRQLVALGDKILETQY